MNTLLAYYWSVIFIIIFHWFLFISKNPGGGDPWFCHRKRNELNVPSKKVLNYKWKVPVRDFVGNDRASFELFETMNQSLTLTVYFVIICNVLMTPTQYIVYRSSYHTFAAFFFEQISFRQKPNFASETRQRLLELDLQPDINSTYSPSRHLITTFFNYTVATTNGDLWLGAW